MAKKKTKPAANPSRGFATTSVASKPKAKEAEAESRVPVIPSSKDAHGRPSQPEVAAPSGQPGEPATGVDDIHQLSPEELEERLENEELQLILDEHMAKTKREYQRQVTRLQTDCRLLRNQAQVLRTRDWLSSQCIGEILQLAREDLKDDPASAMDSHALPSNRTEQLLKLWTLEKVLAALGFSEMQVNLGLQHAIAHASKDPNPSSYDISDCLEHIALHFDEVDLPSFEPRKTNGHTTEADDEDLAEVSDPPNEPLLKLQDLNVSTAPSTTSKTDVSLASGDHESLVSDLDSDLDPDELADKYLSIKRRLHTLQPDPALQRKSKKVKGVSKSDQPGKAANSPVIAKLVSQLETIEGDILFDKRQAEHLWELERIRLVQDAATRRKLELPLDSNEVSSPSPSDAKTEADVIESTVVKDNDDELIGDLFLEPSATDTGPMSGDQTVGATTKLRDFGKGGGLSPRRILEDTCRSRDSSARLTYKQVSPTTYSCQHSVTIAWTKSQTIDLDLEAIETHRTRLSTTFTMKHVAAIDTQQSESFVSVAALFCIFSSSPREEKAHLRLAPVWRDVWQEFSVEQKAKEDAIGRAELKRLRTLIREWQDQDEENEVVLAPRPRAQEHQPDRTAEMKDRPQDSPDEHLRSVWLSKASSPSYQNMLPVRSSLPIFGFKEQILHAVDTNRIVILCGETGCGKSTQLPAYVLESELSKGRACRIYCTEPRRISAVSLAERVSAELGEPRGAVGTAASLIGYAIRLESQVAATTRLTYATVGIVLRMLESNHALDELTHLIIDEVHERSIDTDFLLIIVKALLLKRPYLKIVLMSATVDAERFSKYFDGVPILNVPGRTFPVQTMFLEDAVEMTKIASRAAVKQSKDDSEDSSREDDMKDRQKAYKDSLQGYSPATRHLLLGEYDEYGIDYELITRLITEVASNPGLTKYSKAFLVFLPGIAEIRELNDLLRNHPKFNADWLVFPMHSTIASEEQQQAFVVPPPGTRKVVLATNIAETGITIPDITCVIDTGKHKEMRFDERRQLSRLLQSFVSRSNAKQRRGRAGRVQEGICFHLFSKYRHDNVLAESQTPEMLRLSLQDLVMRVKICKLGNIEETLGQALDPPAQKNIRKAIDALVEVGALTSSEQLTPLGQQLAKLPLDAVLGKLCLLSSIFGCLDIALTIAAVLSSKSPFVTPFGQRQQADSVRLGFKRGDSDLLTVYNAYATWRKICTTAGQSEYAWCRKNFLSPQTLGSIEDLKAQLLNALVDSGFVQLAGADRAALSRYRYAARHRTFIPVPASFNSIGNDDFVNAIIAYAFYPKVLTREGKGWRNVSNNQSVSIHPTSVNKGIQTAEFLSYYSIMQSSSRYLNAQFTNLAIDFPLALFAGNSDFKLSAGVIIIDGNRLRFSVREWKTLLAIKILRAKLREVVSYRLKNPHKLIGRRLGKWMGFLHSIFEARAAAAAK